jgi:uncharacterized protein
MFLKLVRLGLAVAAFGFIVAGFSTLKAAALSVPPRPTDIPIVDQTNTLTAEQKSTLAAQIASERAQSGNQIAIVIVPTLENGSIEKYSLDIAREWGIGTAMNNNGVLLLVVKNDRLLRIEVGTGLEGVLTDVQSGRIIRNDITPLFRQDKYYEGVQAGLTSIIGAINGEYKAEPVTAAQVASFPWEFILFIAFFVFSWLGSILARTKSWWAGGVIGGAAGGVIGLITSSLVFGLIGVGVLAALGLMLDKAVSANYRSHASHGDKPSWWAGGGFLGGGGPRGGGGFGGFGGGGFGGGGSSGGW